MAYQSWSVVFGEQPSAAKWNILGSNDSHFNSLIGLSGSETIVHNIPYQANTSNSVRDNVLIQHGYGVIVPGVAASFSETVTFPTAYASAPIVFAVFGGDDTAGSTALGAGGSEDQAAFVYTHTVTATGFVCRGLTRAATNWAGSTTAFYHWVSIGVVS